MPSSNPTEKVIADWLAPLQSVWGEDNLDEELVIALFHYLADLQVFVEGKNGRWRLSDDSDVCEGTESALRSVIEAKANTESGFALVYFLPGLSGGKETGKTGDESNAKKGGRSVFSRPTGLPKQSSDPSNLQIVKKVGRQLESFIELEKSFLERLPGKHVTRKDARKIYNFALSRIKQKADPQPWEQLSRRRHR